MDSSYMFNIIWMVSLYCGQLAAIHTQVLTEVKRFSYDDNYESDNDLNKGGFYSPLRGVASLMHYLRHLGPEPLEEQEEVSSSSTPSVGNVQWHSTPESLEEQDEETESPSSTPSVGNVQWHSTPESAKEHDEETESPSSTPNVSNVQWHSTPESLEEQDEETENPLSTPSVSNVQWHSTPESPKEQDEETESPFESLEEQDEETESPSSMPSVSNVQWHSTPESPKEQDEETESPSSTPSAEINDYDAGAPEIIIARKLNETECHKNGGICKTSCEQSLQHNSEGCRRGKICCLIAIAI